MCAVAVQKFPCPGIAVDWAPGSVWDTYPYQVHAHRSLGWQPIAFSKATNTITIRTDSCTGDSKQHDTACQYCGGLPSTTTFRDFVDQATNISEFANSEYLNARQLQTAMRWLSIKCHELQIQVLFFCSSFTDHRDINAPHQLSNSKHQFNTIGQKLGSHNHILMLLSANDIVGVQHLLSVAL